MMKEITLRHIERKAEQWQSEGRQWHFHMLTPDCAFNEREDQHAFVLESRYDDEDYVAYVHKIAPSDESKASYSAVDLPQSFMELGQRLVSMLYGEEILDEDTGATESDNEQMRSVLEKARQLNTEGIHWHSHLSPPYCALNEHKGKWSIVFENRAHDEFMEVLYDEEPVEDLNRIEVLYYKQTE